jgi:hypothetical protein
MRGKSLFPFSAALRIATVAQMAEQLICNQRVGGSIPFGGSRMSDGVSGQSVKRPIPSF